MPWIVFAAVIWILNVLFVRLHGLKQYWSAGAWSLLVGYFFTESLVIGNEVVFSHSTYLVQEVPVFFLAGITGLGLFVMRFLPDEKLWKLFYLLLITALLTWVEIFLINSGFILITGWSLYYSFIFKFIALVSIAWLSQLTVRQRKGYFF